MLWEKSVGASKPSFQENFATGVWFVFLVLPRATWCPRGPSPIVKPKLIDGGLASNFVVVWIYICKRD